MTRIALPACRINALQLPQANGRMDEDVVMIHGLAASLGFWYAVAAGRFRQFGRVTLYDMRGHGNSDMPLAGYSPRQMAQELGQLLDHLKLERVHLIAHSFGGMVALTFALLQPERVKSIILADVRIWQAEPPLRVAVSPPRLQRRRDKGVGLDECHIDPSFRVLVELARLRMDRRGTLEEEKSTVDGSTILFRGKRAAQRWLDLMERTRAYQEMTSVGDCATLDDLSQIRQPMLAAFGEHSLRRRSLEALNRFCPRCQTVIIPRAGHFFPLSRPKLFAHVALKFLTASLTTDRGRAEQTIREVSGCDPISPAKETALVADAAV